MITSILIFVVVLSILVLAHEAGHFFAARRSGVLVEEFGFGLPPRLFGKKIGETIYSLNLLPFGGFVRLHGENADDEVAYPARSFLGKSKKARTVIILAGVFMNFILGIAAFAVTYSFLGIPRESTNVRVINVSKDSPADKVGLMPGDVLRRVNDQDISDNDQFISLMEQNKGKEVVIGFDRSGVDGLSVVRVVPRETPPPNEGSLGVIISATEMYFPPVWQRPIYGAYYGFKDALYWAGVVLGGMRQLVGDFSKGTAADSVAGPVGIYALTSQAASFGILSLINFVGVLSVNLAILNVLPFPALDGGRFLFVLLEGILGKRVLPKVEATIHTIGIVILVALILAITAKDIQRLVMAGGVTGYIESVLK